jgi:hypothetical protein
MTSGRFSLTWMKTTSRSIDPAWQAALLNWAAARLGLGLWAAWIWLQELMPVSAGSFYFSIAPLVDGWQGALLGMWQRWDGIHYQAIAEQFYSVDLSVFFPAYPLLARFFAQATGLPALAVLLAISAIATLLDFVLLYQITRDLFSPSTASQTLLCLVLFPTSFFLFGVFPQSLALLWMLLAYRQAGRGRWLAAGLAGLLGGLTHGSVLPLSAMLLVQALQALRAGWRTLPVGRGRFLLRGLALLSVVVLPLLGMALFLAWREAAGFPSFFVIQETKFFRIFSTPWETLWVVVQSFPAGYLRNWVLIFNTLILLLAAGTIAWGWRRLPLALNVYQVVFLFFFLSSRQVDDPLVSLNRYIVGMFPMFMVLGLQKMRAVGKLAYFGASLLMLMGVSAMFFMWKWIG